MSLSPGVTSACTVGGAVVTSAGIMYPLVSTFLTVTRLEKNDAEVKSQLDLMKSQLDKIASKLKIA